MAPDGVLQGIATGPCGGEAGLADGAMGLTRPVERRFCVQDWRGEGTET